MEMVFTLTVIVCAAWFAFYAGDVIDWLFFGRHSVKPELPKNAPNESTLERWHDAYDAAVLEGVDEAEAVKKADATLVPAGVKSAVAVMETIAKGGYSAQTFSSSLIWERKTAKPAKPPPPPAPWRDPGIKDY